MVKWLHRPAPTPSICHPTSTNAMSTTSSVASLAETVGDTSISNCHSTSSVSFDSQLPLTQAPIRPLSNTIVSTAGTTTTTSSSSFRPPVKWAKTWCFLLLLIESCCSIPHFFYVYNLDDFSMLIGVATHATTLLLASIILLLDPYPTRPKSRMGTHTKGTHTDHPKSRLLKGKSFLADDTHRLKLSSLPFMELLAGLHPFLQVLLNSFAEYRLNQPASSSSTVYTFIYGVVIALLFRRRYSIKQGRLLSEAKLENIVVAVIPKVMMGTVGAMGYLFAESIGCIIHHNILEAISCYDVVVSNNTFAMVFVVLAFIRIWVVPFATSVYSMENVIRFNFEINEMIQFITFLLGGMLGLFMFASSTEIDIEDVESFWKNKDALRRTLKISSFMLLVTSVMISFTPHSFSRTYLASKLKAAFATRHPTELAKVYRFLFAGAALTILAALDGTFVAYASRLHQLGEPLTPEDKYDKNYVERTAKQLYMVALAAWPLLIVFNAGVFFGRPRGSGVRESLLYLTLVAHSVLLTFGKFLMEERWAAWQNAVILPFFALLHHYAVKVRKHLAEHTDGEIQAHLHSYFIKTLTTLPPLIFLFAEGVGCSLRYNKSWCEPLIDSNLVVSLHLACGLAFYIMFNFTNDTSVTIGMIARIRGCSLHVIAMIVMVALSSLTSFLVFGMRPDTNAASYIFDEMGEEQATAVMASYTKNLKGILLVNALLWIGTFLLQGIHVKREYQADVRRLSERKPSESRLLTNVRRGADIAGDAVLNLLGTESRLSIGRMYRYALMLIMYGPLLLELAYVKSGHRTYEWAAATHFELSLLCIVMFLFTNFEEARCIWGVRISDFVACGIPTSVLVIGAGMKGFERDPFSSKVLMLNDVFRGFLVTIAMGVVYRSKGSALTLLSDEEKVSVVQSKAFRNGFLGVFPPVLYVGAELSGCMVRNSFLRSGGKDLDGSVVAANCAGLFSGSKAVTMHLVATFYLSVSFAQLEDMSFSMQQIMKLELTALQITQLTIFVLSSTIALSLYGTRDDGPEEPWQFFGISMFYLTWFLNLTLESCKTLRGRLKTWTISIGGFRTTSLSAGGAGTELRGTETFSPMQMEVPVKIKQVMVARETTSGGASEKEKGANYRVDDEETPRGKKEGGRAVLEKKKSKRGSAFENASDRDKAGWRVLEFANKSHSSKKLASRPSFAERKRNSKNGVNKAWSSGQISSGSSLEGAGEKKAGSKKKRESPASVEENELDDALNEDPISLFDPGFL